MGEGFVPSPLPAHQTGSLGVQPELLLGSHYVSMVEETTGHMTKPNLQPQLPHATQTERKITQMAQ